MLSQNRAERLELDLLDAANSSSIHAFIHSPTMTLIPRQNHFSDFHSLVNKVPRQFPDLSLGAPDVLDKAISLGQSVQGVVALTHRSDEAAEGVDVVLALDGSAVLVNLRNRDLDGAVVLGLDDAVGSAALAGDVAGDEESV